MCGLPKELCVCEGLDQEESRVAIYNERRKWGKVVTMAEFKGNTNINLDDFLTKAKKKFGSGGTVRGKAVELRGDFRIALKKFLINLGFPEENIIIKE